MEVKIKDLEPNPFRDIKNYPIDSAKVESLAKSITQTGFWDNILGRLGKKGHFLGYDGDELVGEFDRDFKSIKILNGGEVTRYEWVGKVEIAYGHHRLMALLRNCAPDFVVDIPVKDLDDATMIRIMANENDESWALLPGIIHETVRVTYEYLKKFSPLEKKIPEKAGRPTQMFKNLPLPEKGESRLSLIAWQISEWLRGNWSEKRVYHSLDRLGLIEKGELDKEAVESLPTEKAARDFTAAVKVTKATKVTQKKVAKKIVESRKKEGTEEGEIKGKYRIEEEFFKEEHGAEEKARKARAKADKEVRRLQFENYLTRVRDEADSLKRMLRTLLEYQDYLLSEHYQKSKEGQAFVLAMAELFDTFRILMGKKKSADLVESFKLLVESKKGKK